VCFGWEIPVSEKAKPAFSTMILTPKVAGSGYQRVQFGCNYGRGLIRCQDRLGSPKYFMELMKEPRLWVAAKSY
jgi:hypothetical protein